MPSKRNYLENNVEQFKIFQDELNTMNNWINNLHLDLIRQNSLQSPITGSNSGAPIGETTTTTANTSSSPHSQSPISSKSSTPSPSASTNNLVIDSNVSENSSFLFFLIN